MKDVFKMDRSAVSKSSFNEADDHVSFWQDKTPKERLDAASFIINNIYGVTPQTKVDRAFTSVRKHSNG